MTTNWNEIRPGVTAGVPDGAEEVPAEVIARFKSTRGLGRTVKSLYKGTKAVRTIEGTVYLIPATPKAKKAE